MHALPLRWSSEHAQHFRYVPVISDALPEDAWTGRTGFVHRAVMQDFPDLSGHQVYACGAPIICSDIEGFRDVVQDGHDCVMFPVHDTDALADRLIMLLGDASLRLRLAETGLARVQRYAWPRVTDAILRVYESVLATPRPAEVTTP